MTSAVPKKAYGFVLRLLFAGALAFLILCITFAHMRQLVLFVPDDASYFLKIAQNVQQGNGFSFDGLHTTNGFQPLWQYITVALLWPVHNRPETALRVVLLFQVLLLAGSALLFYRVLRKYVSPPALLVGAACFVAFVLPQSCNGMETALLVFMLALLLLFAEKYRPFTPYSSKKEAVFGVLLGLTILTRLDFVFLCLPFCLFILYQSIVGRSLQKGMLRLLIFTGGIALPVLPYLLYNYVVFGHFIPISGQLKFQAMPVSLAGKIADLAVYRESCFALVPPAFLLWFWVTQKRQPQDYLPKFLALMASGLCLLFLYHLLFMQWIYFSWYFVPYSLFAALAVTFWAHFYLGHRHSTLLHWGYGLFVLGVLAYRIQNYATYASRQNNWSQHTYDAALWVKAHTQPNDILAMKDAGHFGFFSERRVINLDGLVNTFDFQQTLQQKQLRQYLVQNRVRYIAQHSIWQHEEITDGLYQAYPFSLPSHLYGGNSDSVWLQKQNEVYRSQPYEEGGWRVVFLVWELKNL